MTVDLTRRTLLQLAGATSLAMAAAAAARAEGDRQGGGPTYASRTPMRIGMATLRVKNLDKVTDYYRDVIGLSVMERSGTAAKLGTAGITLLVLEARSNAAIEPRNAAGLYHTAFLMPTRKDLARWLVAAATHRVPLTGFADHLVSESVYLDDPEGNGIEIYADRDPSLWQWSEGSVKMATDELDIPDLLSLTNTRVPDAFRMFRMITSIVESTGTRPCEMAWIISLPHDDPDATSSRMAFSALTYVNP